MGRDGRWESEIQISGLDKAQGKARRCRDRDLRVTPLDSDKRNVCMRVGSLGQKWLLSLKLSLRVKRGTVSYQEMMIKPSRYVLESKQAKEKHKLAHVPIHTRTFSLAGRKLCRLCLAQSPGAVFGSSVYNAVVSHITVAQ